MVQRKVVLALTALLTLVVAALVFTDFLPVLRGPAPETPEWYWVYQLRPLARWAPALLLGLSIAAVAGWWLTSATLRHRSTFFVISALSLLVLLLQLAIIYADRPSVMAELVDRTLSVQGAGYFWTAANLEEWPEVLNDYAAAMPSFESEHARTHPPGLVILNRMTIEMFNGLPALAETLAARVWPLRCTDLWLYARSANVAAALGFWALLPLLAAALSPFPAYLLGQHLFAERATRLGTLAVATMPALLVFAPQSDQLFVPLTLLLFWLLMLGLEQRRLSRLFLAGVVLSFSTFLTFGNAVLLLPVLVFGGLWSWKRDRRSMSLRWWLQALLAFGLGGLSLWLVYWLLSGQAPWEIALTGVSQHYELVTSRRDYGWWLGYNLVDLVTFLGLPWLVGFLWLNWSGLRNRFQRPAEWLALAVLVLLVILDLSGSTRGEVGRLWLFMMPLIALTGGAHLAEQYQQAHGVRAQFALLALQLLLVLGVGLAWRPTRAVVIVASRPSIPPTPEVTQPVGTQFGEQLALAAYQLSYEDVQPPAIGLTLVWQAYGPAPRPYSVFNHLVDEAGQLVAQRDGWPVEGQWPPSCWQEGETIIDRYLLELPDDLQPGTYRLYTGLYDAATGDRVLTTSGTDAVLIDEISLPR